MIDKSWIDALKPLDIILIFNFKSLALPVNCALYSCNPKIGVNLAAPNKDVVAPHNAVTPDEVGFKEINVTGEWFKLKSLYHLSLL